MSRFASACHPPRRRRIAARTAACLVLIAGLLGPWHAQIADAAGPQTITSQVIGYQNNVTTTNPFSTTAVNELLVVFVSMDGDSVTGETDTLTGAGLTWTNAVRANAKFGMASIWWAIAPSILTNQTLTSTRSQSQARGGIITVQGFLNAAGIGATHAASGTNAAESVSLTTLQNNGWVWGAGSDWDSNQPRVAGAQTIVDQQFNPNGDTYWDQRQSAATATSGTSVPISDTGPSGDRWNMASVEIDPPSPYTSPPTADVHVSTLSDNNGTYITSPPISTTQTNQVLTAWITDEGPPPGGDPIATVTGGGLTWTKAVGTSAEGNDASMWWAVAASPVTNIQVVGTHTISTSAGFIIVDAWTGVDPVTPVGATQAVALPTGAITGSITTTRANSWVWAVGADYTGASARTLGSNQSMVYQQLDTGAGDTYWTQQQNTTTPSSGTSVTMNDTAPSVDQVDFVIVELLATPQSAASLTVNSGATVGFASAPGAITFPSVTLASTAQTVSQSPPLDISDLSGSGSGWNLQVVSTNFVNGTHSLPAGNVQDLVTPPESCDFAGECALATDSVSYPFTMSTSAQKLVNATAGTGMGAETITPSLTMTIPATAYSGTYAATWTFSLATGP